MTKKKRLVISAVNCVDGGILSILQDCVGSVCSEYSADWDVIVLANSKKLLPHSSARIFEFPKAKQSWITRLAYELILFRRLSEIIHPDVWLSLHDISANVKARRKIVYCHNPSPFYSLKLRDAVRNWKFTAFSLFYGRLYGLNIHSNDFVIVQQDWMRREFQHRYRLSNVIVAHPEGANWPAFEVKIGAPTSREARYRFFYPFVPRFFKNAEIACKAARILCNEGHGEFEVILTLDGTENNYARVIRRDYGDLPNIIFVGRIPRDRVFELYESSDCLIFASKLETWGLPITEFKFTGRPMLLANFPYAHETAGSYSKAYYFNADDERQLARLMLAALSGNLHPVFNKSSEPAAPYAANWSKLWKMILPS